jgi:hypothetical protein
MTAPAADPSPEPATEEPDSPSEGWYCSAGSADTPSHCGHTVEECQSARTFGTRAEGESPPECTWQQIAYCGVAQERGLRRTPFAHCHASEADCLRMEAMFLERDIAVVHENCAAWD